ncbi:XrtA/PEP-CTERM system histidine kinase PrsK [Blastomonas sp.]|uniref:XrtA/PEP-CTERM system histidine kinase PrsK n=1 Tax=Blastomonas sp. TaxID=1909299 RepID=UPI00261D6BC8|nr:XrtA/PEP-CTERM system histidine kinase PrsK [Blastomonas sp.]MDM7955332.1 PEP-CTERM system histidine kinase PrsK [Blastomonas sp.]
MANWHAIGLWGHAAAAALTMLVAAWLVRRWAGQMHSRPSLGDAALLLALLATSLWAFAAATLGGGHGTAGLAESMRNLAWLAFLFQMVRSARAQPRTVTAVYLVLAVVLIGQPMVAFWHAANQGMPRPGELAFSVAMLLRMIFTVGVLVLANNLYSVADTETRASLRLPLTALAAMWLYDLNLYTVGYLGDALPADLVALRGVLMVFAVPFFALAANRPGGWKLTLSRKVAYRSLSLFAILGYLVTMIAVAQMLRSFGGAVASSAQVLLVLGMSLAAMILLPSDRFRAWFRVKATKHFFQHRYDYRAEWIRFTETIGRPGDGTAPFHERVIKAAADISDSPSGLLLAPTDGGRLQLQARFNWPTADVPAQACTASTIGYFQATARIVELEALRSGKDALTDQRAIPDWILAESNAWAIVPLVHFDRLAGLVVLSRPVIERQLDWEDLDLLRLVGRQLASYLAEARSQEALREADQFDEFNRRMAFVMHDIKNLVSQLSLVARNAERHADNPEFRADMIATLQNSVGKMNTLIQRLTGYARSTGDGIRAIDAERVVRAVIADKAERHPVVASSAPRMTLMADPVQLEQVLGHLIQNAIDASGADHPVYVSLSRDGLNGVIEIVDHGSGMSTEFVRAKLFKPFISSKADGFGIGAYEARLLVEAMNGRIEVESREGEGSRFAVYLPLATRIENDEAALDGPLLAAKV